MYSAKKLTVVLFVLLCLPCMFAGSTGDFLLSGVISVSASPPAQSFNFGFAGISPRGSQVDLGGSNFNLTFLNLEGSVVRIDSVKIVNTLVKDCNVTTPLPVPIGPNETIMFSVNDCMRPEDSDSSASIRLDVTIIYKKVIDGTASPENYTSQGKMYIAPMGENVDQSYLSAQYTNMFLFSFVFALIGLILILRYLLYRKNKKVLILWFILLALLIIGSYIFARGQYAPGIN